MIRVVVKGPKSSSRSGSCKKLLGSELEVSDSIGEQGTITLTGSELVKRGYCNYNLHLNRQCVTLLIV